jgi:hypothetical protein
VSESFSRLVIHIRRFLFQLLHAITVTQRKPPRTKSPHRSASEQFAAPFWTGCSVSCLLVLLRPGELELGAGWELAASFQDLEFP